MMKHLIYLTLCILPVLAFGQKKPQFNVECQISYDTSKKYAGGFEKIVQFYLEKEFTCCKVVTKGDITRKLDRDRFMQLMYGTEMQSYCKELACDYFMILYLVESELGIAATASCYKWSGKIPLARETIISKGSVIDVMNEVGKNITEKLTKYEICPFEGQVALGLTSVRDTTMTDEYSVYCNSMDYQYKKVTKIYSNTTSSWDLQKKDQKFGEGTVVFTINESNSINEDNGCYKCQSGREGGRSYNASGSLTFSSEGLSSESNLDGKEHTDARIELQFLPNDTYTITIKATSKKYPAVEKWESEAIGTCDNVAKDSKTKERQVTVFANPTFGPFNGKPSDRLLSGDDTKTSYDPVTKEKTTITLKFDLTRD